VQTKGREVFNTGNPRKDRADAWGILGKERSQKWKSTLGQKSTPEEGIERGKGRRKKRKRRGGGGRCKVGDCDTERDQDNWERRAKFSDEEGNVGRKNFQAFAIEWPGEHETRVKPARKKKKRRE